jgi:hypothetical protein
MQRVPVVTAAALLLSFLLAASPLPSSEGRGKPSETLWRYYHARHLEPGEAYGMLLARCGALQSRHSCDGSHDVSKHYFQIRTDAPTHEALAEYLKEIDVPLPTRVFRISLLLGTQKLSEARNLPEGSAKAVEAVRRLFPNHHFRPLATGGMRLVWDGRLVLGDLPGYEAVLRLSRERSPDRAVQVESFRLHSRRYLPREAGGMSVASDTLIHTAFGIEPGETVVVGTTTHESGEPLVVLLTAAR